MLAEVKCATEALITIRPLDVNANGVFIQARQELVALNGHMTFGDWFGIVGGTLLILAGHGGPTS